MIRESIEKKISNLNPTHFDLVNESHMHSVPKNSETHFRLLLVCSEFQGLSRVQRQRKIYELLGDELKNGLHALTMRLLTPEEFSKESSNDFQSPACHGGNKKS